MLRKEQQPNLVDALAFLVEEGIWIPLGQFLLWVQDNGLYRESQPSFTAWMEECAESVNISSPRLWRYRNTTAYLRDLLKDNPELPDVLTNPVKLSAENIEILERLARVAPKGVRVETTRRVLNNEVTVNDMRTLWNSFRPKDYTSRAGRGAKTTPKVDEKTQMAGRILSGLSRHAGWTGSDNPQKFTFLPKPFATQDNREVDAVVLVQEKKDSPLTIHVIDIKTPSAKDKLQTQIAAITHDDVDYVWVATPIHKGKLPFKLPKGFGLVMADEDQVEVVVPAKPQRDPKTTSFMRELLSLLLKR